MWIVKHSTNLSSENAGFLHAKCLTKFKLISRLGACGRPGLLPSCKYRHSHSSRRTKRSTEPRLGGLRVTYGPVPEWAVRGAGAAGPGRRGRPGKLAYHDRRGRRPEHSAAGESVRLTRESESGPGGSPGPAGNRDGTAARASLAAAGSGCQRPARLALAVPLPETMASPSRAGLAPGGPGFRIQIHWQP